MAIDAQEMLLSQLMTISNQGVADNQRLAQNTLLAYQKDLFQGAQGETPVMVGGMNLADRVPVVKTGS
jgi:hypothetical protein